MQNFKDLWKTELKEILKKLKLYKTLTNELWNRGKQKFKRQLDGNPIFLVDYHSSLDDDYIYDKALKVYEKFFGVYPQKEEIIFKKNENISWWFRVFMDDNLVDLSFNKVKSLIK